MSAVVQWLGAAEPPSDVALQKIAASWQPILATIITTSRCLRYLNSTANRQNNSPDPIPCFSILNSETNSGIHYLPNFRYVPKTCMHDMVCCKRYAR